MNCPRLIRCLGAACLGTLVKRVTPLPNTVFILVDNLGWTDTTSFGSYLYQTPICLPVATTVFNFNWRNAPHQTRSSRVSSTPAPQFSPHRSA